MLRRLLVFIHWAFYVHSQMCPSGTVASPLGNCVTCPPRYYCPDRTETPILCPRGSFCAAGSAYPIRCPIGWICPSGSSTFMACSTIDGQVYC